MNRRRFLQSSLVLGLSSSPAFSAERTSSAKPFVTSEVGKLRKVIVHSPGEETRKTFPMMLGGHSMLTWELLRKEAGPQHAAMVKLLRQSGAEVLQVESLLDDAIAEARRRETFHGWLRAEATPLVEHEKEVSAATLLGREDRFVYHKDESKNFRPLIAPATSMFFTRDLAVMTPRGVVLCNFNNKVRTFEAVLARFMFKYAAALRAYPVLFDASKEGVFLQGGDVMVLDAKTLLVGVGNTSQVEAASRLAKMLDMDVLSVQMPSLQWEPGEWEGLQLIFYHLDCLVNFVDRKTVLAVPYLLEKEHVDRNPLLEILFGFARIDQFKKSEAAALLTEVRNVGWLRRFQAGTGDEDESFERMKLVDYLKKSGCAVINVGGNAQADENKLRHVVERVIRESRFMATNMIATAPGHVVAYQGNDHTMAALREGGVDVQTFASHELVRANGGPHCLTLPLERDGLALGE